MKKVISIICICIICAVSLYGCGEKVGTVQESTAPAFADTTAYTAESTTAPSENRKDFNVTIGKIESVNGNTVTVLLADTESMFGGKFPGGSSDGSRPQFPEGEMPEDFESFFGGSGNKDSSSKSGLSGIIGKLFGSDSDNGNRPEFPGGNMPEGFDPNNMPEGFDPNNMPEGFDPNNKPEDFDPESFSGEMPEGFENFAGFGGMSGNFDVSSLTFGTDTKTYVIPENLKIGDGNYTSLKTGDIIMIMFGTDGSISAVNVVG